MENFLNYLVELYQQGEINMAICVNDIKYDKNFKITANALFADSSKMPEESLAFEKKFLMDCLAKGDISFTISKK